MSSTPRAMVASSFTIIKGALVEETYAALATWDFALPKRANIERIREQNLTGAKSAAWARDIAKVLNRRFEPEDRDRALVLLAKHRCPLDEWNPVLLWHMTRDEFLLRDFLQTCLFRAYDTGGLRLPKEEVVAYLKGIRSRGAKTEHSWTEQTMDRVAVGLLRIAADFALLREGVSKGLASYHLPERSFLYLLHALRDERLSPARVISAPDWRMYLMRPSDVERELLRLHQFKKLDYQVAGSLVELSLPCQSSREYAERMVA